MRIKKGGGNVGGELIIRGGRPLYGTVRIPAAKNSILPLLAAALLCQGQVTFEDVPALTDVENSLALLKGVGCGVSSRAGRVRICPPRRAAPVLPEGPARAMRSSVFYLAPLLHRAGSVTMPLPGGCRIGARPIDIHLDGLAAMGARVEMGAGGLTLKAPPEGLRGVDWRMRLPSVGATETLMMAAVLARGVTVLRGAACEPEIEDLARFLGRCGALICGAGTPTIWIQGVRELEGTDYTPIPDRIAASTLAGAVAGCGGRLELENCRPDQMAPQLALLKKAGCRIEPRANGLTIARQEPLAGGGTVYTGGYPAFATDAAPVTAAAFLTARGETRFCDRVFENRFSCAEDFAKLGAQVRREGCCLVIRGVRELQGCQLQARDLRGGAALVTAALCAAGESRIRGVEHIQRGYEDIAELYSRLGARIRWAGETGA